MGFPTAAHPFHDMFPVEHVGQTGMMHLNHLIESDECDWGEEEEGGGEKG